MRERKNDAKVTFAWHDLDRIVAGREAAPPKPGTTDTPDQEGFDVPG